MNHQRVIDRWRDVLRTIEVSRSNTSQDEAIACLDMMKRTAEDGIARMEVLQANEEAELKAQAGIKAGDFVASLTDALGIPKCAGCAQRQAAMNAVDMNQPALDVVKALAQAVLNPDKRK